jgi:hypothetical protein
VGDARDDESGGGGLGAGLRRRRDCAKAGTARTTGLTDTASVYDVQQGAVCGAGVCGVM